MLESIQIAYSLFNRNSIHENTLQKQAKIKFWFKVVKCKRTVELLDSEHQVNQGLVLYNFTDFFFTES